MAVAGSGYLEILRDRNARRLLISAFPARLAYSMIGLAIFFKVVRATGSIAAAGIALGATNIAGSLTAGIRGSIIDRWGQTWPLWVLVPGYATGILLLDSAGDKNSLIALSLLLGFTAPPINLSTRPLWKLAVPAEALRSAYAMDAVSISTAFLLGPVCATYLSLSSRPSLALESCAAAMLVGGALLATSRLSREWVPEKKRPETLSLWRVPGIRLMALEGASVGFGWGAFNVGIPAFATLEKAPQLTAPVFAVLGICSVIGGTLAGLLSRRTSALAGMRRAYLGATLAAAPLAFTHPGISMGVVAGMLGLFLGGLQVFYWEVVEAIRPKGSAVAALGWLWTIEGSCSATGSALAGVMASDVGPQWTLSVTSMSFVVGFSVITIGRRFLSAADHVPDAATDEAALADSADSSH